MVAAAEFHLGGICRRQLRGRGSREEAGECFARKRCLPTKMACEISCRSVFFSLYRCVVCYGALCWIKDYNADLRVVCLCLL